MRSKVVTFQAIAVALIAFCGGPPTSKATPLWFNDGQTHNIDWTINQDVIVADDPYDQPTTFNLLEYGFVHGSLEVRTSSKVTISGGWVEGYVHAYDWSELTFSSGLIREQFFAENSSRVNISGGLIDDILTIQGNSKVTISGGEIAQWLTANNTSNLTVSGGDIGQLFRAYAQSVITFVGTDFAIDGVGVNYGQYFASDYSGGTLTGVLNNGDSLDIPFYIYDDASIVLIPEPSTLLLLGLGLVMLRRKYQL